MNKYINIVLLSVFGLLTTKYNMGLTFYIPFVCYYSIKNIKNLLLIIPFSFASVYFFNLNLYIILLIFYLTLLFIIIMNKNKKEIILILYSIIINCVIYYIIRKNNGIVTNYIYDILVIIITPIILLFLIYNNKTPDDMNKEIRSIVYNEALLAFILSIGSSHYKVFDINISLILAIYFAMYFSSNRYIFCSVFYSFAMMILFKTMLKVDQGILVVLVSFIYLIPNMFSSMVLILLLMYLLYFESNLISEDILYLLGTISMIFELLRPFIINKNNKIELMNNIYERAMSQIDIEVEAFALFLDKIVKNFASNEYNEELGDAIGKLSYMYCSNCGNRTECFAKNKGKIYYYLKNCILNNSDNFICAKNDDVKRTGRQLGYNLINKNEYVNDLLAPLLNSVSNILRQYKIDHNITIEIDFDILNNLKQGLENYGYSLSLFNVVKTFKNDYIIELGIIGICFFDEKENIEHIASHYLKINSSATFKEIRKNKTYVTITPKTSYDIIYGYGSISKIGNNICGDNYLVKEISNRKLVAAICDGMGKGINANIVSTRMLKLLEEVLSTNLTSETALQILNSFYYIQDYQEKYSTLDYVEINRLNGEMLMYKAGATYTYIFHKDGKMERIENENLPFGLNELVITKKVNLCDQDLVIMASDGIFDNIVDVDDFENFIKTIKGLDPQKISYELLNYARHTDLISKDDMSVIALKVRHS